MKAYIRSVIYIINILSVIVILPSALSGQPAVPTGLSVFPRYASPIVMVVQWNDNSNNEDGFTIERREAGTLPWTSSTTIGSFGGTGQREWVDNTAAAGTYWEYRVCATSAALGNSAFTPESYGQTPEQLWPIHDGDHDILHSFGTPLDFMGGAGRRQYLHEGVDISASGKRVDAAQGGIIGDVNFPANSNGGGLRIDVDWGPPTNVERISYQHTVTDPAWAIGDPIAAGDSIGAVNTTHFGMATDADHVHWGTRNRNILIRYNQDADRDPDINNPLVTDINNDADDFFVVDAAANDHRNPREPAWGDVDFLVDASDDLAANLPLVVNPYRISYWIQSVVPEGENVQNATTPYCLAEFSFFIPGPEANQFPQNALVYWDLPADIHGINTWQSCLTWIVTNTSGTDGSRGNIDAAQFWRTDARKGSGARANGSDALHARENQDAKFPDGKYHIHIILDDLVHQTDNVRSIIVDNSRPYIKRVQVSSGAQPVYLAQWLWNDAAAQLEIQPSTFNAAAAFSALRTQDVNIEVEFSEPMETASIVSILPINIIPTLISTQMPGERTVWKGIISNLDIADDGSDDGIHMITFDGTDPGGNSLLQIHDRNPIGADNHNRDNTGAMRGTAGTDNIHGFRIGPLSGVLPVTAIFMKQSETDPANPSINDRTAQIQQALNTYFSEITYGNISFSVTGCGWYQLDNPVGWYYTVPQTPLIDLVQEAINNAQTAGTDISTSNYILVVTEDDDITHGEWSTNGGWPYQVSEAPGWRLIAGGTMKLGSTDARLTNLAGRWVGLIDLFEYPYVSTPRPFTGEWSHMSDKENMVDVMGWDKWRAGWLDETGTATGNTLVRVAKPPVASPIVNMTHTLYPVDLDNNDRKMVAIEAADRLHYTAEYRRQKNLDTALPDSGILIVKANDYLSQGEGPAIVQESPVTAGILNDATFKPDVSRNLFDDAGSGINIEVISMNPDQAEIRINYTVPPTQNDVYVSPHDDRWKAEDIWVDAPDNEGNFKTDPVTVKDANEKPVIGSVNKVYARVRNRGHADATNFEVILGIRTPWGAGGPWDTLRIETVILLQGQDHATDAYYLISADWTPENDLHSCVQVTVTGVANDINPDNNWTQENISEFVTTPGSPYAPVISRFEVENPYDNTLPVFFKLDGMPPGWSYIMTPERLVIPSKGVGTAQVTIQPNEAAPLCSDEQVTISAFVPQVDALKRLGAITLQIALKNGGSIQQQSWVDCGKKGLTASRDLRTLGMTDQQAQRCIIYSQGCTRPKLANTEIAVIYTAPDGTKSVHYVVTDENGCYLDMIAAGEPGNWEVQATLPETDCQAGDRTPPQIVDVDGGFTGPWRYFSSFGPNFPMGNFNNDYDPGFSLNVGVERSIRSDLSMVGLIGFHQFYSPYQNQHLLQTSLNAKFVFARFTERFAYVNAGPGMYKPRYGSTSLGVNIGTGMTWIINPKLGIDLNLDYHLVNMAGSETKNATFLDIQMGIIWSY